MLTRLDPGAVKLEQSRAALLEQLRVQSLEGFGAEEAPAAICAAGAIVSYLRQTQLRVLGHIHHLEIYSTSDFLVLDAVTQRSLELTRNLVDGGTSGTLLEILDHTKTPMGGRLLRQWILQPLQDLAEIVARQDSIASFLDHGALRDQLAEALREVRDLERIMTRIHLRTANARDLLALARSLRQIPAIKSALLRYGKGKLLDLSRGMATLTELADWIEAAIVAEPPVSIREGGMIRDGYNPELDGLREITRGGKDWIGKLRQSEIERTGINSLKIGYTRVFGYYIEVSKSNLDRVPPEWERRQTLTNGERYVTPELKEKEALILGAEEKINEIEGELFEYLRGAAEGQTAAVHQLAREIAETDALLSLAQAALIGGYIRPEVDGSDLIEIRGGRHPVVEAMLRDRPFVANDVLLDTREKQIWIITGPNMAGKSTFIRQVALLTLLAHMGSFVPAKSARVGLVDRIFTRVGATDYLTRGQSTFLVAELQLTTASPSRGRSSNIFMRNSAVAPKRSSRRTIMSLPIYRRSLNAHAIITSRCARTARRSPSCIKSSREVRITHMVSTPRGSRGFRTRSSRGREKSFSISNADANWAAKTFPRLRIPNLKRSLSSSNPIRARDSLTCSPQWSTPSLRRSPEWISAGSRRCKRCKRSMSSSAPHGADRDLAYLIKKNIHDCKYNSSCFVISL